MRVKPLFAFGPLLPEPIGRIAMNKPHRKAMTLLELVVSMGLLAVIMLPLIGLMGTTYRVYAASSDRQEGSYLRTSALDACVHLLRDAESIVAASPTRLQVKLSTGAIGELSFGRKRLVWKQTGAAQVLAIGLANAKFSTTRVPAGRLDPDQSIGSLVQLKFSSQRAGEPNESWSTTSVWVRPTI